MKGINEPYPAGKAKSEFRNSMRKIGEQHLVLLLEIENVYKEYKKIERSKDGLEGTDALDFWVAFSYIMKKHGG